MHQLILIESVLSVLTYIQNIKKNVVGSNLAEGFGESSVVCNSNSSSVVMGMWDVQKFNAFKSQHIRKLVKSELDTYLEEEDKTTPDFDILMWWKVNRSRYLILSEIARDLLAVPVSTVASESAFSAGGRCLSPHRSRLYPSTVEALMCTQNWIWAQLKGIKFSSLLHLFDFDSIFFYFTSFFLN